MEEIQNLVRRAYAYADRAQVSRSTLSRKLLGNGIRLAELESGKSLRVDTLLKANQMLDEMERAA